MGMAQAGIVDQGINIIPATVSSVDTINDFQPTILPREQGLELLKAVVSHSPGFSVANTLWMKNSYPRQNGLLKSDSEPAPTEGEATDSPQDASAA